LRHQTIFKFITAALFLTPLACQVDPPADTQDEPDVTANMDTRPDIDMSIPSDMRGDSTADAKMDSETEDMRADPIEEDMKQEVQPDMKPALEVTARNYCELTSEMFCDYYLRCGRIAADSIDECQATFMESCNGIYEPVYAGYAEFGALELSSDGIDECRAHLSTVSCDQQIFDLDGGCANVWAGQVEPGGACAPGIGSFVCEEGSTCIVGLDLCGTCEATVEVGQACTPGEVRCAADARCVQGACVARARVGEQCIDEVGCVVGSYCSDGVCAARQTVTVGEACDQVRRCPYRAECRGGTCIQTALLGESCDGRSCASGYCDGQTCQPLRDGLQSCNENGQCISGQCNSGFCTSPVSQCLIQD